MILKQESFCNEPFEHMRLLDFFSFKNRLLALILMGISVQISTAQIVVGANRTETYLPMLSEKSVAVVANATSVIFHQSGHTHLVDSLLSRGVQVKKIFTPEHGFRGEADAGALVESGIDPKTQLPLVSLYGSQKKPSLEHLEGVDILLFDIQDVGVRFYTYIATLQLVMEAAADASVPVIVLDRPNPNGNLVDGPVLQKENASFLGYNTIPLAYGMTIGEYALMIRGEGWIRSENSVDLTLISLSDYTRDMPYHLPIKPSPNLPNDHAIAWYPSLGLFEGTEINAGRGTPNPFERFGSPQLSAAVFDFEYTPVSVPGARYPKHLNTLCYGRDLSKTEAPDHVCLNPLIESYKAHDGAFFREDSFAKHSGRSELQGQIESGMSEEEIRASWRAELEAFKSIRSKYLRYP